ncbi:HypC/HybG/HupF family hydrogenase formation chaperone [Azoarcus olearius]|uniref:Hydrogenase expression/formation protein hupF n=1 Tax=Azoarcus sp. (strain BH72) TaxID=418699 RepID=A1KC53_AZOSB|nr:HypC/HybG/HupF family hydrogenase formation chaperone [Azoarcus olearius]CAL96409.1 putative Hydrogenase expression/formation protein hupF [Azoarcus olearius]
MCVGIPVQVLRSEETRALCRDRDGSDVWVDLLLVGEQPPGTWLMCFLGAAREVIDADTAQRTLAALAALDTLMAGGDADLDAAFADLVNREPELPDFLKPQTT